MSERADLYRVTQHRRRAIQSRYHNLYFTGASTHPGTGLPTAMVSGRLSAQRILDDFQLEA